ncbi:MAG: hypothetical protein JWR52_1381 [Marmoricola sp.]|nr:hypothetical protein [Marmoricola sp.]
MSAATGTHDALVRAWAADLRAGSAQRWADFRVGARPASPSSGDGPVPSAAQLELVRRLDKDLPSFGRLADLVLATAGPGRGLVDVPLPGGPPGFGTPPVEPDALPADELVRIACGVLVTLLIRDVPAAAAPPRFAWRPWRRGVTVLGAPMTAAVLRDELRSRGIRDGGRSPTCLVLGGPLDRLMAERWSARVAAGGGMRWQRLWESAMAQDRLPPGIQLGTIAARLSEQFGAANVHVILAEDPRAAVALAGEILGLDLPPAVPRPGSGLLATDLLRVLNPLLVLNVGEDGRDLLADQVWPGLAGVESDLALAPPPGKVGWAQTTAERVAADLRAGDYAVHGDPGTVVPVRRAGARSKVDPEAVLEFALGVLGRSWVRDLARSARPDTPPRRPTERQG